MSLGITVSTLLTGYSVDGLETLRMHGSWAEIGWGEVGPPQTIVMPFIHTPSPYG